MLDNNFKKHLQLIFTYCFYKKYDYIPEDKLRMFLDNSWIIENVTGMRGVLLIRNKISNINTKVIRNTLLLTDMDYVTALCKNLLQRHDRSLI